ncbi:MAG: hypothetical protein WCT14_22015 [Treponemataceae bacterium]
MMKVDSEKRKTGSARGGFRMLVLFLAAFALVQPEAWARGGFKGGGFRSSGFRSSGSSRSFSTKSAGSIKAPSFKGWGSAVKPSSTTNASTDSRFTTTTNLGRSSFQGNKTVYDNARRNGTLFSSKTDAQSAFKDRYGSQYGTKFASEPSARPAWIPQTSTIGGRNVNILYNPSLGGYGYMDSLGRWMLYDAMADAVMMNSLMNRHDYYYGSPVYASHSSQFINFALTLLFMMVLAAVILNLIRRSRGL